MPRRPVLSGWEVVKASERLGFEQVRQRLSRLVLRRGERGTVVPLHREVKPGTLPGILRQAQVTSEAVLAAIA